jgi:aminopeptidase YwaD
VGSEGNREATRFFAEEIARYGWDTEVQAFEAIDWKDGGAELAVKGERFDVLVSPYSLGFAGTGVLAAASTVDELDRLEVRGKILLLHGEIAQEQLMPKNFVFYNPEEHRRIIAALEQGQPLAIVAATGRNPSLAGGVYPFPLIEDGDFDIPSVYMTEEEGRKLLPFSGETVRLVSRSERIPGKGYNVIARKGNPAGERVILSAHIDTKKGTPGAIDNGTGVVVLLLLAELLGDYRGERLLEIVPFNGEDYYAAPAQMLYLKEYLPKYERVLLNINIDGAGYKDGISAFSFYNLPEDLLRKARAIVEAYPGIKEGGQWYQGDHTMFLQQGIPAMAVSSEWFSDNIDDQHITHTPRDRYEIVDHAKVVEIASALKAFLQ